MDKSQLPPIPPRLPRKRNSLSAHIEERDKDERRDSLAANSSSENNQDLDPEVLAAFEQAVKETPSSVEVDLAFSPAANRVTAPIIEDYIDPFTVPPVDNLLKEALQILKAEKIAEEIEEDFAPSEKK